MFNFTSKCENTNKNHSYHSGNSLKSENAKSRKDMVKQGCSWSEGVNVKRVNLLVEWLCIIWLKWIHLDQRLDFLKLLFMSTQRHGQVEKKMKSSKWASNLNHVPGKIIQYSKINYLVQIHPCRKTLSIVAMGKK